MSPTDSTIDFSTFNTIKWVFSMVTFTLKDYVANNGQVNTGKHLGVTQIAISKALRSGRSIFVQVSQGGEVSAYETKPFPSKKKAGSGLAYAP